MKQEHITENNIKELKEMQTFLEDTPNDDINMLIERLTKLNSYMARSGYLLAVAKADYDCARAHVFEEYGKAIMKMPATISQKFIESQCPQQNYIVTWIERINRTCVHQGDNIRTQISFGKEQMALTRRGY